MAGESAVSMAEADSLIWSDREWLSHSMAERIQIIEEALRRAFALDEKRRKRKPQKRRTPKRPQPGSLLDWARVDYGRSVDVDGA